MLDGTTSLVAALAALVILIERISARVSEYRSLRNGSRPLCKEDATALEERIQRLHDDQVGKLRAHVEQNAREHRELHEKIDAVRSDVAYIRGKIDHR